jgi:hypothetical protein
MIEFTKAFLTSDSKTHSTLEEAKRHELDILWSEKIRSDEGLQSKTVAEWLLENADKIVDILTTTASSKPRARKVNGGKKTRKAAVPAQGL